MCSTPLQAGDKAPYVGQLLTPDLAIKLGQKAVYCDARIKLEVQRVSSKLQIDLDLEKQLRRIDQKNYEKQKSIYEKYGGISWYEKPWFVATVSVALTVLVFWGARETLKNW